ncbi:hypothetical protein DFA_08489 [Cavenderia fasciculata]|uniref:ADP-ribosylation like factor n=1 Tax=Cavenderia fasciculata TaxID=261658 RepID=F4Q2M6_CACFS|nr:uncharacterized protein DFA_08489 [Cavenderia fasciculata]EGG17493.1 hypothetical protein DFA_08489 [Cavenderia fasciculata]|eukprot:XP_004355977.1 hypothetical protein DFA_08489 [Cavenderia fasciculata]
MGLVQSLVSCQPPTFKIVMMGMYMVGKTTILYRLKDNKTSSLKDTPYTNPSLGFNVETIKVNKSLHLYIWDVSSLSAITKIRYQIFPGCRGIIYVLESTILEDSEKLTETREDLLSIVKDAELDGQPLLILVNKMDMDKSSNIIDRITTYFNFNEMIKNGRAWSIFPITATTGQGLNEAIHWLDNQLTNSINGTKSNH